MSPLSFFFVLSQIASEEAKFINYTPAGKGTGCPTEGKIRKKSLKKNLSVANSVIGINALKSEVFCIISFFVLKKKRIETQEDAKSASFLFIARVRAPYLS